MRSMSSLPRISIKVLRHGRPEADDITNDVIKVDWLQSISAPWQSLTVTWKATVSDSFTRVMEGDWIDFRITSASAQNTGVLSAGLLHVDATAGGFGVSPIGGISTQPCTFKATSWWNFLSTVNIYSVFGWTEDVGTVFTMATWSKLLSKAISDYTVGNLGESFKIILKELLSKIKLPINFSFDGSTVGSNLSKWVAVFTEDDVFNQWFKPRPIESIDIGGGSPTRIQSAMGGYENSIVDFVTGTFVPEPMLIELFPSFEPIAPDTTPGQSGGLQGSQTSVDSTPSEMYFGGFHTLILRMKPFRDRPLREAAVSHISYRHDEVERALKWQLDQLKPEVGPVDVRAAELAAKSSAARVDALKTAANASTAELLSGSFERVTWDYGTFTHIDPSLVRAMTWSRDDRNRINCSSIKLSFEDQSGIEGLLGAGLPITYDEEIERHGLRVSKPTWTYSINIAKEIRERALENKKRAASGQSPLPPAVSTLKSKGGEWTAFMRSICAQFMQFYKNNHMFLKGTLSLNLTEAITNEGMSPVVDKVLMLRHGEAFAMTTPATTKQLDTIYGYCETISHSFSIREGGIEAASTTVEYSRGHIGVSKDALITETFVPMRDAVAAANSVVAPSAVQQAQPAANNCVVESTYGPNGKLSSPQRAQIGIRIYATMRAAGCSPALAFALAHQASFESAWQPDAIRWCRRPEFATDIGLFQINYAGFGMGIASFAGGKPAHTRYSIRYDASKHWDASDPFLNCKRVIDTLRRKGLLNDKFKSPKEAYHAVWFDSGLTSGAGNPAEYNKRDSKGDELYIETRAFVKNATWLSGFAEYTADRQHQITQLKGIVIKDVVPAGYNVTKTAKSPISGNVITLPISTNPGPYVSGGVIGTKAWDDPTFSARYTAVEGSFSAPLGNLSYTDYFKIEGSYDKLGVDQGIFKLLSLRFK